MTLLFILANKSLADQTAKVEYCWSADYKLHAAAKTNRHQALSDLLVSLSDDMPVDTCLD